MNGNKIFEGLEEAIQQSSGCVFSDIGVSKPDFVIRKHNREAIAYCHGNIIELVVVNNREGHSENE